MRRHLPDAQQSAMSNSKHTSDCRVTCGPLAYCLAGREALRHLCNMRGLVKPFLSECVVSADAEMDYPVHTSVDIGLFGYTK